MPTHPKHKSFPAGFPRRFPLLPLSRPPPPHDSWGSARAGLQWKPPQGLTAPPLTAQGPGEFLPRASAAEPELMFDLLGKRGAGTRGRGGWAQVALPLERAAGVGLCSGGHTGDGIALVEGHGGSLGTQGLGLQGAEVKVGSGFEGCQGWLWFGWCHGWLRLEGCQGCLCRVGGSRAGFACCWRTQAWFAQARSCCSWTGWDRDPRCQAGSSEALEVAM